MRKIAVIGCGALLGAVALSVHYFSEQILGIALHDLMPFVMAAIAVPLVGYVVFDFKAFSRAAAQAGNQVLARLGFRSSGVGSLCRPHGL